jgi:hypothetical protein
MFENDLLLILEEDLAERFIFFEAQLKVEKCVLPLKNILTRSRILTLVNRIRYKNIILKRYEEIKPQLARKQRIFLSNAEGFIAKNIIDLLKRDYPETQLVVLQHGIFVARDVRAFKSTLLKFANAASRFIFGIYLAGEGFGRTSADKYIVYNSYYSEFLVKLGWEESNVIVSAFYLKGFSGAKQQPLSTSGNRSAIFLLQCLHAAGISSRRVQDKLIERTTELLSFTYDSVQIKQHPYCNISLPKLPPNCAVVNADINELASSASLIVSFFSTALIDVEHLGIPTVAVRSRQLKVDPGVYDLFRFVHDYDSSGSEKNFTYSRNICRESTEYFYQTGASTPDVLFRGLQHI